MSVVLCPEIILKGSTETKTVNVEYERNMGDSETLSSAGTPSVSPTTSSPLATASVSVSGTQGQMSLSGGFAGLDAVVGTSADDTFTLASHGLSDNWPVRVYVDGADDVPTATDQDGDTIVLTEKTLYVVSSATNTFKLALVSGGTALTLGSDGRCSIGVEYTIGLEVTSGGSPAQTLRGEFRVRVR